jgi:hypothetical protein
MLLKMLFNLCQNLWFKNKRRYSIRGRYRWWIEMKNFRKRLLIKKIELVLLNKRSINKRNPIKRRFVRKNGFIKKSWKTKRIMVKKNENENENKNPKRKGWRGLKKLKILNKKYKFKKKYLFGFKRWKIDKTRYRHMNVIKQLGFVTRKKFFFFLFTKLLKIFNFNGELSKVKNRFKKLFYIIKKIGFNPYIIIIEAILNSFPLFEYKAFTNKRKGKNVRRIKKTAVKIYFKPLEIKKSRQIFLGFNSLKKYNKVESFNFALTLIKTAFNKGNIIKDLNNLNLEIYTNSYKLEKNLKNNVYF